ncbi:unnamed protein product [Lampetra fluviatilis]
MVGGQGRVLDRAYKGCVPHSSDPKSAISAQHPSIKQVNRPPPPGSGIFVAIGNRARHRRVAPILPVMMAEESGIDRTAAARTADRRRLSGRVGIPSMVALPLVTRPVSGDRHGGLREGRGGVRPLMAQHPDPEARCGSWRRNGGAPGDDAGLARWRGQNGRAPYWRGACEPRGGGGRGRGRGWREAAEVREGRPQRPEGRAELDLVRGRAGSQPRRGGSRVQLGESDGRGRRNSSSVPQEPRAELEERPLSFKALEAFLEVEPWEIALRLSTPRSGLRPLLKLEDIRKDFLELLIRVVGRASTSKTNRESHHCLVGLVKDSKFLKLVLPIFITSMPEESSPERTALYPVLVSSMLDIASALLAVFPNSSIAEASLLLTLLNATVTALCHGGDRSLEDSEGRLRDLQRQVQARQERRREGLSVAHGLDSQPPENFRELPLYPSYADIRPNRKPFVRPNIVCGRYPDAATYLDVQFRLLREDFMRPLREGIAEVLGATAVGGARALHGRFNDVRVYPGASVVAPICTPQGLVHSVRFDAAALHNVRWENSKRLLFGSLVCLSSDGFATMLFGTVAERSAEDLRRGFVCVAFAPESRGLLRAIGPRECFLMAESTSYFEAFRYVLEGLKEVDENELPFSRYLVDCEKVVEAPWYLRDPLLARSPSYDFSCLLLDHHATAQEQVVAPALRPKWWPTKEEMGLDESQMEALVVAVTQELSIIQGPPGTGKTYVGLKIAELLLNNKAAWNQVDPGPILVVCYTNHALDQFLEGITKMLSTDGVVRVGGRCSRDSLESCTLRKLRVKHRDDKPAYLRRLFYEVKTEMAQCQQMLEKKTAQLMATHLGILRDSVLMSHVDREHWEQLEQVVKQCMQQMVMGSKRVSYIMEWLGLGFSEIGAQQLPGVHGGAQPGQDEEELEDLLEELEEELEEELVGNRMIEEDRTQHEKIAERRRAMNELHRQFVAFSVEDRGAGEEGEGEGEEEGGRWQSTMSKRNMKRMVTSELKKAAFTSDEEEKQVQNVWHLAMAERWRLYRLWVTRYQTSIRDTIADEEDRYQRLADQLSEVRDEEDHGILKEATVIGMTTTGAAKFRGILQKVRPKIVIVEEAAEVLEAHIITTLSSACKHLILIGDHQQLRPSASVYELAKRYNLEVSLFERLVKNSVPFARLSIQHRMRPEIAKLLVPHIYDHLENHPSVLKYENVKGIATNLYFVQHSHAEVEVKDTKSRQNLHEADFVVALCKHLLLQGYAQERITVLTTYTGQLLALRKRLPRDRYGGVRVCVVDKYQGEENDLVLLSLVRSNARGQTGFLNIDNRVCVALSRARIGFFIVGDAKMLSAVPLWKRVIGELHAGGRIGPALMLRCQNHPEREAAVVTAKDFARAPEGGCELLCEFRLDCGHVCTRSCHAEDPEHKKFECQKPCSRTICELGHRCRKVCHKQCGKCTELVAKTMAACGHEQMMPCHVDTARFSCRVPCPKPQACGHACPRLCGNNCLASCVELVRERQVCGHECDVPCGRRHEPRPCHARCQTALACGHACHGNCRWCKNGRWHAACGEACERSLPCSHQCTAPCAARGCPPCALRCRNRCVHSACARPCGQPCMPCAEPCEWRCEHHICRRLCYEECDRPRCDKPCRRRLPCGHACVGYCGEPCPSKCRICHAAEVTEIFFGNEDEPSARFVELEDCEHLVEGTGLDRWMETSEDGGGGGADDCGETPVVVKLKECPKCKTPIRRNLRYGNIIKRTLGDIEAVKRKLWGSDEEIAQAKNRVQEILAKVNPKPLPASPLRAMLNFRYLLLRDRTTVSEWNIPTDFLSALLAGELNLLQVNTLENKATLLADIAKLRPELSKISTERKEVVKEALDKLVEWMCEQQTAGLTEQQLQDLRTETLRLSFLIKVQAGMSVAISVAKVSDAATAISEEIMKTLTNKRRFGPEQEKEVRRLAESLQEELPKSGLGISDSERASIVKAIGLTPGHWYKCPRGHVYAIGECGGAMEKGTCPECGEQIGGEHHSLQAGNAVATEMDGARHAAWSDTANNMFNYDQLRDFP